MKALVIGGSGSIGSAIVNRLLSDGYEVIVHYNNTDINKLKFQFNHSSVQLVQCDLRNVDDFNQYFHFIKNLAYLQLSFIYFSSLFLLLRCPNLLKVFSIVSKSFKVALTLSISTLSK